MHDVGVAHSATAATATVTFRTRPGGSTDRRSHGRGSRAKLALGGLSVQLVVPQRLEHNTHVHQPEMRLAHVPEDPSHDVVDAALHLHKPSEHEDAGARRADSGSGPHGRVESRHCECPFRVRVTARPWAELDNRSQRCGTDTSTWEKRQVIYRFKIIMIPGSS